MTAGAVHQQVGLQACQKAVGGGLHVVVMVPRRLEGIHALLSLKAGRLAAMSCFFAGEGLGCA